MAPASCLLASWRRSGRKHDPWHARRGADGTAEVINAREYAPASASVDMYAKHKEQQQRGGKAVAVPLELLGLRRAWERHGKLPWKSLLEPSIR